MNVSADLIVSILTLGAVVALIIGTIVWVMRGIREQKRQETQALQAFEQEFRLEFTKNLTAEKHTDERKKDIAQKPSQAAPASKVPEIMGKKFDINPASSLLPQEQLIALLREAELYEATEGPYRILDPSGESILIRLKQNKTALIVPRFESEHFVLQALKRFDYVFLVAVGHHVIVLNKYSDFIAAQFNVT